MSDVKITINENLLVERMAELFGFDRLAEILPGDIPLPYLYLSTFLIFDHGIAQMYIHFATDGTHILLQSPSAIVSVPGLYLGAFGIRYISDGYSDAVESFPLSSQEDDFTVFNSLVSFRAKLVMYIIIILVYYPYVLVGIGWQNIFASQGVFGLVNTLLVWQIGYFPFVIEFGLLYFGIHFLLPRRIAGADVSMFFYDTRNMGGFAVVGNLLKYSYYIFTVGLLLYFIFVYGPFFSIGTAIGTGPGLLEALIFSIVWLLGIASIAYSMFTMHRFMAGKKNKRIAELEAEVEDIIENPYDINNSEVTNKEQLEDIYRRRQEIRDTRVYPATFTMWSQIAISVILPQALNVAVQTAG